MTHLLLHGPSAASVVLLSCLTHGCLHHMHHLHHPWRQLRLQGPWLGLTRPAAAGPQAAAAAGCAKGAGVGKRGGDGHAWHGR